MRIQTMVRSALLLLLCAPACLAAQPGGAGAAKRDTAASQFRVNFAVPDAPAFDILSVDPSNILRPSSVQELGVAVSNFAGSDNTFRVPRSFAVEFAPFLLARGRSLTLDQYRDVRMLYHLRLSAATDRTADSARTQVGLGIRLNLLDEADPRLDSAHIARLTSIADSINTVFVWALTKPPLNLAAANSGVVSPDALGAAARAQVERLQQRSKEVKEEYAEENWNEAILDVAYAFRGSAVDSLGNDPRVDAHNVWATLGIPVRSWGQLLIGARGGLERGLEDEEFGRAGSLAARFFAGTNDYKFFVETELRNNDVSSNDVLFHGGGELNVIDWAWTSFSFGVDRDRESGNRRLVTRLSVKSGLPKLP